MRILFTGGSGKAGRHVVPYLVARGHRVLNADLVPLDAPRVDNLTVDVTDSGQVFNALTSYANFDELEAGTGVPSFDAVVHFAAVPRILLKPDNETYRVNVMSTYNVLEAAVKLGIKKVIFASSETTYGICFADGARMPEYLPVDEDHPVVPEDSYAMSKVANEVTARSFQRRSGIDIYGIRINNVIEPDEYERNFPTYFEHPAMRERNIFGYIDARDLGQMVDLMLAKDGLGFEIFNAANDDHSVNLRTREIAERFYPNVPFLREMGDDESFYSNEKAKRLLGFAPKHGWRQVLNP
ncbi:NAD-dependent epimerase/dehydratase family protein [Celeribacter baekdonensis]|uniref:NAD-dependent epimerase/dehydratase family protein n=1 Tax=Celeribacter baekdonensis TaxID=875171 RepID=UPI003A8EDC9C